MGRTHKSISKQHATSLGENEEKTDQSTGVAFSPISQLSRLFRGRDCFPIELIIMVVRLIDPRTMVALALCSRCLFREISHWPELWKEQYCRAFLFNRDDSELEWLRYFVERQ